MSTRSAGFNTIDLVAESPPVQVMQVLMMYLSALPVALVIRSSTEEAWSPDIPPDLPAILPRRNRLTSLLRRALQRDLCVLVLAYYTVSAIERNRILSPDTTPSATPTPSTSQPITLFAILYELVSAYGTVGLSLSTTPESLSASLRPLSRLVITLVMLLGRHRGLGLLLPRMYYVGIRI